VFPVLSFDAHLTLRCDATAFIGVFNACKLVRFDILKTQKLTCGTSKCSQYLLKAQWPTELAPRPAFPCLKPTLLSKSLTCSAAFLLAIALCCPKLRTPLIFEFALR
jgi:hypothetical protein